MQEQTPLQVLIVDDNCECADSLAALARAVGHNAHVAYDAISGFRLATKVLPHIIFHDIQLPGMNGYDAARLLRADRRFQTTMLVAVTGNDDPSCVLSAQAAGFDRFLSKPLEYCDMQDALYETKAKLLSEKM